MKKFMLFISGLVAFFILLANLGPMIILALGISLLYIVFKKFTNSESTSAKIGWIIVGLLVLSITVSNIYALIGVAAAYVIYLIIKSWNNKDDDLIVHHVVEDDDPFTNFEREWKELNRS